MYTKSHQGIVSKTVTVEFENGYSLTFDADVEIGLFVVIAESTQQTNAADGCIECQNGQFNDIGWCYCPYCGTKVRR